MKRFALLPLLGLLIVGCVGVATYDKPSPATTNLSSFMLRSGIVQIGSHCYLIATFANGRVVKEPLVGEICADAVASLPKPETK